MTTPREPAPPTRTHPTAEALRACPGVRDAAVAVDARGELVAFVALDDAALDERRAGVQQKLWEGIWDRVYEGPTPYRDPTLNAAGWVNAVTGSQYTEAEVADLVEPTAARILALRPRRALELGCGTGMLLLRVAPRCERYVGLDPTAHGLAHVRRELDALGPAAPDVTLLQRSALDVGDLAPGSFDLFILNSVVQYFPSADYLLAVLRRLIPLAAPSASIFLGDLRSAPLLPALHAAIVTTRAQGSETAGDLLARARRGMAQERELALHPAVAFALTRELPRVTRARVELRRGRAASDALLFRYDLVLELGDGAPTTVEPGPMRWLEYGRDVPRVEDLARVLDEERPDRIGVRGVPNRRLAAAMRAEAWLRDGPADAPVADLRAEAARAAETDLGIDPEALWALAETHPYEVQVGFSGDGATGHLDVLLRRSGSGPGPSVTGVQPEARPGAALLPVRALSNEPGAKPSSPTPRLVSHLGASAPGVPIPDRFVFVAALSREGGAIDVQALCELGRLADSAA